MGLAGFGVRYAGPRSTTELSQNLPDRDATLAHLSQLFRRASRLDHLMSEALDVLLDAFACDRAWLLYPCDPDALSWRVPMERTRHGWPGALAQGVDIPMNETTEAIFRRALADATPARNGPSFEKPVPEEIQEHYQVQTQMTLAIQPVAGQAWLLGLHACREPIDWTDEQAAFFQDIGTRLGQVLTTLLALEDQRMREAQLRNVLDMSQEAIVVLDARARIVDSNVNAALLFGLPQASLTAQHLFAMSPPTQPDGQPSDRAADKMLSGALRESIPIFEWCFRDAEGALPLCEVRLALIPGSDPPMLRASISDITRRREIEERQRHAERMESIGRLVGGIAHDFNNLLAVIYGSAELAAMRVDAGSPAARHLATVIGAAGRGTELTSQLLSYASKQVIAPQEVDLSDAVQQSQRMVEQLLTPNIQLHTSLSADVGSVLVDPGQLVQILLNLVANGRDAMPEGGGITIETGNAELDAAWCSDDPDLRPGRYGVLTVSDEGMGMDAATRLKVFEPFFTTKPRGEGTGLGLATVYGIARQHRGLVTVSSELGTGSCFTVYLPTADGAVADIEAVAPGALDADPRVSPEH
jgi:PAS domain S-box-containing protein